ncbi:SAM-dependent methyltransferase [Croceivirga thetidis]|uniref:SAM-dependent methyltransferase n=1 Tax=Croceivirga thetidis TaxID=2721623 RepID=A0ABX1GU51_9FLAO|nr:SAM-dependent methyltransferase [Croceivirga thetidis]NKI32576.1 SAM-dependent methyltransferase [Croceivirga thetidis]
MGDNKPNLIIGNLYLIPTTLGDSAPLEVLPYSVKQKIESIQHFIAENEKTARRFIKKISPSKSQPDLHFEHLNKFTDPAEIPGFLDPCIHGLDVGLLSEAGCPGIADPGADVVRIAHEKKIQVVPLVGPSSILLALMSSGMNGQSFAFNGYLPIDAAERTKMIKTFERNSREFGQTQIFIETPYRNDKLIVELLKRLQPETRLCIAVDITLESEYIATKTVREWNKIQLELNKRPAIFIIQA